MMLGLNRVNSCHFVVSLFLKNIMHVVSLHPGVQFWGTRFNLSMSTRLSTTTTPYSLFSSSLHAIHYHITYQFHSSGFLICWQITRRSEGSGSITGLKFKCHTHSQSRIHSPI